MANKRDFKKFISTIGSDVCEQIMINYYSLEDIDRETTEKSIGQVLAAVENANNRANIIFDKGPRAFEDGKEYSKAKRAFFKSLYKKINKDFIDELDEALKTFNSAVPEKVKQDNKDAVAAEA